MNEAITPTPSFQTEREGKRTSLAERLSAIADDLARQAGPNGRRMARREIDALWSPSPKVRKIIR